MTAAQKPRTLLLVEDDDLIRDGLTDYLRQQGFTVVPAPDGQKALDYIRQSPPPDLVLLDMMLPVLDGWRFLEQLREVGPRPAPPIVISTATQAIGREWALAHGCAGFVHKPIEPELLLKEVYRCLAKADHVGGPP